MIYFIALIGLLVVLALIDSKWLLNRWTRRQVTKRATEHRERARNQPHELKYEVSRSGVKYCGTAPDLSEMSVEEFDYPDACRTESLACPSCGQSFDVRLSPDQSAILVPISNCEGHAVRISWT